MYACGRRGLKTETTDIRLAQAPTDADRAGCRCVLVRLRNAEAFAENEDRAVCLLVPNKLFTTTAERTLCNRSTCGGRGALLLEALAGCI